MLCPGPDPRPGVPSAWGAWESVWSVYTGQNSAPPSLPSRASKLAWRWPVPLDDKCPASLSLCVPAGKRGGCASREAAALGRPRGKCAVRAGVQPEVRLEAGAAQGPAARTRRGGRGRSLSHGFPLLPGQAGKGRWDGRKWGAWASGRTEPGVVDSVGRNGQKAACPRRRSLQCQGSLPALS